ncbi:MAG TPA: hypothetical protein VI758_09315 [Bacteroidota bacterium]
MRLINYSITGFVSFCILTQFGMAGPPFRTDDPVPIGFRHGEFYLFSSAVADASGIAGIGPAFEFNYGALPDVHLHIVVPVAFSKPKNGAMRAGYGDTELGVKYRFFNQTDLLPDIATFPIIEVPTGNAARGFGNGKPQVYLPLWLQKDIGDWTIYGGAGYWINPGAGNRNWKFSGLLVQYNFAPDFFLGMEIFHQTASSNTTLGNTGLHFGGGIPIAQNSQLIFSADAGNGITSYKHFAYYVGLYHQF